ncbi:phosphate ABC transporter substrate-binding protein, partial [Bacteroides xylanisolvens]
NKEQVFPLIQFILSSDGQDIIKKSGYIPVK